MKTLYILRHAKAGNPAGIMQDKDRPLDGEGQAQVAALAARMHGLGYTPDTILCSDARRTRETLEPLRRLLPQAPIHYEDALYLASTGDMYERIKEIPDECASMLLVAHNPGIHGLVLFLAGQGAPGLLQQVAPGYRTGCLSVITCPAERWRDVQPGSGTLENVLV